MREFISAGQTLHGFDDDAGGIRIDTGYRVIGLTARDPSYIEGRLGKSVPFIPRAIRDGTGSCGASMPAMFQCNGGASTGEAKRNTQRIFIGFGARIHEENVWQVET